MIEVKCEPMLLLSFAGIDYKYYENVWDAKQSSGGHNTWVRVVCPGNEIPYEVKQTVKQTKVLTYRLDEDIDKKVLKLFQIVNGKGDSGRPLAFYALNSAVAKGWLKLAKQVNFK